MTALSVSQRQDVATLLICRALGVEAVMIGATAYRLLFPCRERYTLDIDLALADQELDYRRNAASRVGLNLIVGPKSSTWTQRSSEER